MNNKLTKAGLLVYILAVRAIDISTDSSPVVVGGVLILAALGGIAYIWGADK